MRTENTIKIAIASVISQVVVTVLGFINRIVLVKFLGNEYLGFTGLFSNIIGLLSLTELGLGSAIAYNLYKPLHEDDKITVISLVKFYRNIYHGLALVVLALGSVMMLFLQYLIRDLDELSFDINYIRVLFFLTLLETVFSYLIVYKTSLLNVGQKKYIITYINTIGQIVLSLARILILIVTHNYIAYVFLGLGYSVSSNYIASKFAEKYYPYIKGSIREAETIDPGLKNNVLENALNLSVHSIAGYAVNCTDNLLISSFVGVITLGIYSNYNLIFSAIKSLMTGVLTSLQSPLGDLVVTGDKAKVYNVLKIATFSSFALSAFCSVSLFLLSSPFINIVFGKDYVLSDNVVLICALNIFIYSISRPIWSLSSVTGLFKDDKINAFVEAAVNLIASIIFARQYGLFGVFLGTFCSYIVAMFLKTRLQFRKYFNLSSREYFISLFTYLLVYIFELYEMAYLFRIINLPSSLLINFVIKIILCLIIPNAQNYLLFRRKNEWKYLENTIKSKFYKRIPG